MQYAKNGFIPKPSLTCCKVSGTFFELGQHAPISCVAVLLWKTTPSSFSLRFTAQAVPSPPKQFCSTVLPCIAVGLARLACFIMRGGEMGKKRCTFNCYHNFALRKRSMLFRGASVSVSRTCSSCTSTSTVFWSCSWRTLKIQRTAGSPAGVRNQWRVDCFYWC